MLHDATLRSRDPLQARIPPETKALTGVYQERDLLRLERDLLRLELEAAQVREQAALEREQAAREREVLLLCMVEQVQQNQCLLDMPRSTPPAALSEPSPSADPHVPRGDMRFGSAVDMTLYQC